MVLGSFQCRGILILWHMIGHEPVVLAAGVERMAGLLVFFFFLFVFFSSRLSHFRFLMPRLLGDDWT